MVICIKCVTNIVKIQIQHKNININNDNNINSNININIDISNNIKNKDGKCSIRPSCTTPVHQVAGVLVLK